MIPLRLFIGELVDDVLGDDTLVVWIDHVASVFAAMVGPAKVFSLLSAHGSIYGLIVIWSIEICLSLQSIARFDTHLDLPEALGSILKRIHR